MQLSRVAAAVAVAATACLATVAPASAAAAASAGDTVTHPNPGWRDVTLVTLENANVSNFQRRTVFCPDNMRVIGGGAEARGERAILVGSFPTDDRRGWIGLGRQDGFDTVGISVFAICAR
jgi:hypothetical protein